MDSAAIPGLTAIGGVFVGAGGVVWKGIYDTRSARARDIAIVRRRYLEPLRVASLDLRGHLEHILRAYEENDSGETQFLERSFLHINKLDRSSGAVPFELWCNGEGYFATATLYRAAVYCWAAMRIKRELLFLETEQVGDIPLLHRLENVRDSLGGRYGIWQSIQDSVGDYMKETDGSVIPYRIFCRRLSDPEGHVWLLRVVDFFSDIKELSHRDTINAAILALRSLEESLPA